MSEVMTGNKLASLIRKTKGKIKIHMVIPNDMTWVTAEKADLIEWAKEIGDDVIKMKLEQEGNIHYLDFDYS